MIKKISIDLEQNSLLFSSRPALPCLSLPLPSREFSPSTPINWVLKGFYHFMRTSTKLR